MSEEGEKKLDFSLPARPAPPAAKRGGATLLLGVLVLLVGANLYLTWKRPSTAPTRAPASAGSGFSEEELKQLALKLEKQGLSKAAAGTWKEYLASASEEKKPSAIWYRIGTLYQAADAHEMALEAFYRSESLDQESDLSSETGRRVQESLEALGKFAALKHELAERVGLNEDAGAQSGEVVAEIGTQKITRVELDRQIEAYLENQLAMMAGNLPDEERKQQKEAMLKQLSGDQQRLQFLNSYIVQEILYRKARESKLIEDPEVRAQLRDAERSLLARQVMESELSGKLFITDSELEGSYELRKGDFVVPAQAALSHILLEDEEGAQKVIERVLAGEGFADLARELSKDEKTVAKGGEIADPVAEGQRVPGLTVAPDELAPLFQAKAGDLLERPVKSESGYHVIQLRELTPERQRPLEEVRSQIYAEVRRNKEREIQSKLLENLREQYDVVIHSEAFQSPAPKEEP